VYGRKIHIGINMKLTLALVATLMILYVGNTTSRNLVFINV